MLLAAVGSGSAEIVNFLLEAGADPNIDAGVLF
jgi:ankyrin repeat protein